MTDLAARPNSLKRSHFSVLKVGMLSILPGLLLISIVQPHSPDLIAQLARAAMAETTRGATWWTSWYGGISTPSYSAITPELMRIAGVWTVGVISAAVTVYSCARILEGYANARFAMVLVSFAVTANLVSGRITFAVGAAFGALALMFFLRGTRWPTVVLAVVCSMSSPLAGMFLCIAVLSTFADRHRRLTAALVIVSAAVPVLVTELLFPLPGHMPIFNFDIMLGAAACVAMWLCKPHKHVKLLTLLVASGVVFFSTMQTPVGSNVIRLPMLFMAPVVAVSATVSKRMKAIVIVLCIAWISITSTIDLFRGHGPSFEKSYYTPLLEQLPASGTATHRVEVIDPKTHGPALYVASSLPIARGWERQVDATRNPIFYDGELNTDTYRQWLDSMAVKWVALPNVPLDYASEKEGQLVRAGVPYLHEVWVNKDWHLYEVDSPSSMTTGPASIQRTTEDSLVLSATDAGRGQIKVAWARGLNLRGIEGTTMNGTVVQVGDRIAYEVPVAGTYVLSNVTGE